MGNAMNHDELLTPVSERDHVLGPAADPATLPVYGDYECPCITAALRAAAGDALVRGG
jgi:hypothetical protein